MNPEACCSSSCCYSSLQRTVRKYSRLSSLAIRILSKLLPSFFCQNDGFFRKPTSPPLPLREGPPLISVFSPQGRRGNRPTRCSNRFAIRLADHQRSSPAAELHFAVCDRMDTNRLRAACWVLAYGLLDAGWVLIPVCLILACLVLDV